MFRLDAADHVIGTVQGVAEGILVRSIMQTFNHTWRRHTEEEHNPEVTHLPGKVNYRIVD